MELKNNQANVVVKLLSNGRYNWTIELTFNSDTKDDAIEIIKYIDNHLKDKFPEYVKKSSGRTLDLGE